MVAGIWCACTGGRGESKQPWLLIKADDEAARRGSKADILDEMPLSVVTGRSIPEIAEGKGRKRVWNSNRSAKDNVKAGATEAAATPRQRARAATFDRERQAGAPPTTSRARTKTRKTKSGGKVAKERGPRRRAAAGLRAAIARDAARCCARRCRLGARGEVRRLPDPGAARSTARYGLLTRKGLDWTAKFPNIAAAVAELPADTALIDGEIVVEERRRAELLGAAGRAQSRRAPTRSSTTSFDLLHRDGRDLRPLPLGERKAELRRSGRTR